MRFVSILWKGNVIPGIMLFLCMVLALSAEEQKRNYAVIGLKNAEGVTAGEADIIADRLRVELFNTGAANMMERDQMQEILSEQGFQQSGACTDEACMIEIGQLLGVERLVSGSIGKLGSMFLCNFRTIDVQTAKIVKVVSEDISGGIEDVVKLLPNIAAQLVGAKSAAKPQKKAEPKKKEPEPEVVKEEPEPEPELVPVAEPSEEKPEPVEEVPESKSLGKNKNRSGIRISYTISPGEVPMQEYNEFDREYVDIVDEDYFADLEDDPNYSSVNYTKNHSRLVLSFIIKAGEFITIDLGPGFMFCNKKGGYIFEDLYDNYLEDYKDVSMNWKIVAPNLSLGVNFVKRFFPLKLNVGMLIDMNFNMFRFTYNLYEYGYDEYNQFYTLLESVTDRDFALNFSFGSRFGLEIMGGQHFGFSIDFIYRYYRIEKEFELEEKFSGETSNVKWIYKMPGIGLCAGLNFYY